ncbi:hypothetical protein ACN47E_007931 [Coniothyrium glycines]
MVFIGKPQKKDIRHFFSPTPPAAQVDPDTALPALASPRPNKHDDSQSSNINVSQEHSECSPPPARVDPSSPSTISMNTRATDYDAQPPIASQVSAHSGGSKRVVSNGEQVVLNSDSDTESIQSLDWGEPKQPTKLTNTVTRSKRMTYDDEEALRRPQKHRNTGKQALAVVIETAQRSIELEDRIRERKADLEKIVQVPVGVGISINEETLGQVVTDDEDDSGKAHRLLQAMQRTRAVSTQSSFHFFGDDLKAAHIRSKFPVNALPSHRWVTTFEASNSRDQAFLSGFAFQIFRLQGLPEELTSWIIDDICSNRNELLNTKYFEILESHSAHLAKLLTHNRLDTIFRTMATKVEVLQTSDELIPREIESASSPLPSSIKAVARLLQCAAPTLRTSSRSHALSFLLHACLDDRVTAHSDILGSIQDAVEAIICNFADNSRLISGVLPQLLSRVLHPLLQKNLIGALPSRSPLTAYLRRYLSLSFLLYPNAVDVPLTDPEIPNLIHEHLDKSIDFQISKNNDYGCLAARFELLDVAIGPGLLSVPFQPLLSPAQSQADSPPLTAPSPAASEIKDFNQVVDGLAQHVKYLGNSIVEAGAVTDLSILEAKDRVERLSARLEHAIRIGGKKMHDPFSDNMAEKQLKMSKFLTKISRPSASAPTGGVFDDGEGTHA